jgi:hypothetical protein
MPSGQLNRDTIADQGDSRRVLASFMPWIATRPLLLEAGCQLGDSQASLPWLGQWPRCHCSSGRRGRSAGARGESGPVGERPGRVAIALVTLRWRLPPSAAARGLSLIGVGETVEVVPDTVHPASVVPQGQPARHAGARQHPQRSKVDVAGAGRASRATTRTACRPAKTLFVRAGRRSASVPPATSALPALATSTHRARHQEARRPRPTRVRRVPGGARTALRVEGSFRRAARRPSERGSPGRPASRARLSGPYKRLTRFAELSTKARRPPREPACLAPASVQAWAERRDLPPSRVERAGALDGGSFAALDSCLRLLGCLRAAVGDRGTDCRRGGDDQCRKQDSRRDQARAFAQDASHANSSATSSASCLTAMRVGRSSAARL